jgi:hypothetical protein
MPTGSHSSIYCREFLPSPYYPSRISTTPPPTCSVLDLSHSTEHDIVNLWKRPTPQMIHASPNAILENSSDRISVLHGTRVIANGVSNNANDSQPTTTTATTSRYFQLSSLSLPPIPAIGHVLPPESSFCAQILSTSESCHYRRCETAAR